MTTITFLLKDKSESFYSTINSMTNEQIYQYLTNRNTFGMKFTVNKNNILNDQIEFNYKLKSKMPLVNKRIIIRKGYRLLLFDI